MRGLQILVASDHYPPFYGGAHRQTALLAKELQERGHLVNVATVWHPGLPQRQEDDGVAVYRFKQIRTSLPWLARKPEQRHQPPFPDPITVLGLRRLINHFHPDLIHAYGWISYSVAVSLIGKDIPMLVSARDYGYFCATRSLLYKDQTCSGPELLKCLQCAGQAYGPLKGIISVLSIFLGRPFLLRKTSGMHSVSQYVQDSMERHLIKHRNATKKNGRGPILEKVIPSFLIPADTPVNTEEFTSCLPSQPYILYVGGLQHRKGLGSLLSAYQQLIQPPPLVLIGYPAKDMPKEYPEGVKVLLNVPHANVMEAWDRCLFGVTPSLWPDPSPGVVREAMSRGKAMIVTKIGGSTEMINENNNGLLIPPGDEQALAQAMQRLIDDASLRERLGRAASERAGQYMDDAVVPQFEDLYLDLVNSAHEERAQRKQT